MPVVLVYCHSLHILDISCLPGLHLCLPGMLCYHPIVTPSRLPGGAQDKLADPTPWFRVTHRETVGENYCLWPLAMSKGLCLLGPCSPLWEGRVSSSTERWDTPGNVECVLSRLPKSQRETFDYSALHHLVHSPEWAAVEMRASAYSNAPPPQFNPGRGMLCCSP